MPIAIPLTFLQVRCAILQEVNTEPLSAGTMVKSLRMRKLAKKNKEKGALTLCSWQFLRCIIMETWTEKPLKSVLEVMLSYFYKQRKEKTAKAAAVAKSAAVGGSEGQPCPVRCKYAVH